MDQAGIGPQIAEVHISKLWVSVVGMVLAVGFMFGFLVLFDRLPNRHDANLGLVWFMVVFVVFVVVLSAIHELLHGVAAMAFGKVRWRELKFGFMWKALAPFCNVLVPIPIRAFIIMALFPTIILGSLAVIVFLAYPLDLFVYAVAAIIASGFGDMWYCWRLRPFPKTVFIRDHSSELGFLVYGPPETTAGGSAGNG